MIQFEPYYQAAPWGGRRLQSLLGRQQLPTGTVGEAWELVELPQRHSTVVQGPHAGARLGDLWRAGHLGGSAVGPFPFLLKWIDAQQNLSVQVHPDEATCLKLGSGQPKTEAWYVAHAEAHATLWIGHHPGLDAASLRQAASGGSLQKWLFDLQPHQGDIYLLPAGTLHAIGGGFLLLEVQQPSDTTYRLYDWGRLGLDGKPRPLHLEEASAAVHFKRSGAPRPQRFGVDGPAFAMRCLTPQAQVEADFLRVFVAAQGPLRLRSQSGTQALQRGDVVVAEPADGVVEVVEGHAVLVTEP